VQGGRGRRRHARQAETVAAEMGSTPKRGATRRPVRAASHDGPTLSERLIREYVPQHARTESSIRVLDEEVEGGPQGQQKPEEITAAPEVIFDGTWGEPVVDDCCAGGACGAHGCLIPCPSLCWDNLELFGGAQGFTGPVNRGETGSFGFNEGLNWGGPLPCLLGGAVGMQLGARAVHSNLSGAEFTGGERNQVFVTAGGFRRVDWGLQGGVVLDYLHEDWYLDANLLQLRGELSWVYPCQHELGFWFTANTQHDNVVSTLTVNNQTTTSNERLQATDLYAFFYRHRLAGGGASGRVFAGFTGESDGLLGAETLVPINDCWSLQSGFTYLVPEESSSANGHVEESWNFGLSVVWRPGGGANSGGGYYRPLFDVAHNGNFMVDRR
jgi:hypothetical protein